MGGRSEELEQTEVGEISAGMLLLLLLSRKGLIIIRETDKTVVN